MIVKVGSQFVLYSKDGTKVLGRFGSRTEAEDRERQVNYFKSRDK